MNSYYLYFHYTKDSNQLFYVGIGRGRRAFKFHDRNIFWNNVFKKHGVIVDIVITNLSFEIACALEIMLIYQIGRRDLRTGPLVNIADGGVYPKHAQSSKMKMSKSRKGRKLTEEWKRKIRENASKFWTGKTIPIDIKEKIAAKQRGKRMGKDNTNHMAVMQYSLSGEFLCRHESMSDARRYVNGSDGNISACAAGRIKTAYGYIWKKAI